jgi:hypothetical protein
MRAGDDSLDTEDSAVDPARSRTIGPNLAGKWSGEQQQSQGYHESGTGGEAV